jgi:RNA polymerase sigma-70 factor (ECF subfamily)
MTGSITSGTAESDRADVERVLSGDREHFAQLIDRHQGRIISHLSRLAGRNAAEDLAQDTFVRAYQALGRYDATYPFRGWLLVIATRLAVNHLARRREQPLGDGLPVPQAEADPSRPLSEQDALQALTLRLESALALLAPDARALYEMRFRQEMGIDELAVHFGISTNALKVRIHRLRTQLAERLGLATQE